MYFFPHREWSCCRDHSSSYCSTLGVILPSGSLIPCRKPGFICISCFLRLHLYQLLPDFCCITMVNLNRFLTWWPWPFTHDLDLQTWPRYPSTLSTCQKSRLYVCPFSSESETDRHTDRMTMANLLHPSLTRGVTISFLLHITLTWSFSFWLCRHAFCQSWCISVKRIWDTHHKSNTYESSSSRNWYFSWLKVRHVNLFESNTNYASHRIWSIILHIHEGNIFQFHFITSCMTLVQELLFLIHSNYNRAKTGLRSCLYLNCSHLKLEIKKIVLCAWENQRAIQQNSSYCFTIIILFYNSFSLIL